MFQAKVTIFSIISFGLISALMQIVALRQLMTVFSGNELDLGITLAVWLIAAGLGSLAGGRIRSGWAFPLSFLAAAFLCQATIAAIDYLRPFLSLEFGEAVPLSTTILSTLVLLSPLCIVTGAQFPLAVSYSGKKAAKVYGLEAFGAFAGGCLFTFLFSGRVSAALLAAGIAILQIFVAVILMKRKSLAVFLVMPFVFFAVTLMLSAHSPLSGAQQIVRIESRYGEIRVLRMNGQSNVFSSGKFQYAFPDVQTEELRAHLPMAIHPDARRILVVGGSPAVLRELSKYPGAHIDFIEIDPVMIEIGKRLLSSGERAAFAGGNVRFITQDARKFLSQQVLPAYDLITVNLPEPATASINRFYTVEFYRTVKTSLRKDGLLCLTVPTSSGYIARRLKLSNGAIYNALREAFPFTAVSSEEYGYLFASNHPISITPERLKQAFSASGVSTSHFQPYIFNDAFAPLKTAAVETTFQNVHLINTDKKPVAYLYNLMLWAESHGGKGLGALLSADIRAASLFTVLLLALAVFLLWGKKASLHYSVFTTGFSGTALSLVILLSYQSSHGFVYEMIGFLTALFMGGLAAGALWAKKLRKALQFLRMSEMGAVAFVGVVPFFLGQEMMYYVMTMFFGALCGSQFAAANAVIDNKGALDWSGRLYAVDLAGSFFGAIATVLFLLPVTGIWGTMIALAILKALSFILVSRIPDEIT